MKILAKDLRGASVSLYQMKYRWNLAVTVVFAILMWGLSASFKVCDRRAALHAARMFRFATARGLVDHPNNECSALLLQICCLAIRETAHKALGHGVPRVLKSCHGSIGGHVENTRRSGRRALLVSAARRRKFFSCVVVTDTGTISGTPRRPTTQRQKQKLGREHVLAELRICFASVQF